MNTKKLAAIIASIVLCFALSACVVKEKPVGANKQSASQQQQEQQEQQEPSVDYSNLQVGDTVTLDSGMKVTVNYGETFTPEYLSTVMTRINITYENAGNEKQSFNIFDWKAENVDGVERTITAWGEGDTDLGSGNLKPGGTVTGNVYFDGDDLSKIYYYSNGLLQKESEICWTLEWQ